MKSYFDKPNLPYESHDSTRGLGMTGKTENNKHIVEIAMPGLKDPESVSVVVRGNIVTITGCIHEEEHVRQIGKETIHHKIKNFEEKLETPSDATNQVPQATLSLIKDTCGAVIEGLLVLSWELSETIVPIEIKDHKL